MKVYEGVIYERALNYFQTFFNEILCGLSKAYNAQHTLFELLTSWQTSLNRGGFFGPFTFWYFYQWFVLFLSKR